MENSTYAILKEYIEELISIKEFDRRSYEQCDKAIQKLQYLSNSNQASTNIEIHIDRACELGKQKLSEIEKVYS